MDFLAGGSPSCLLASSQCTNFGTASLCLVLQDCQRQAVGVWFNIDDGW